jgi:aryl-alcohol dehydrogenase (NADP+)
VDTSVTTRARIQSGAREICDLVGMIAQKRDVSRAQIGLAWVLQKPGVTAPIVGASKPVHLTDAAAALAISLAPDEIETLESPYVWQGKANFQ